MKKCRHCGNEFNIDDYKEVGIDPDKQGLSIEDFEYCSECAEGISDFEGDFNIFHPEETIKEFVAHEDWELD